MGDGRRILGEIAAVGEAVRRHIDHAHDARLIEREPGEGRAGAGQPGQGRVEGVGQAAPRRPGARLAGGQQNPLALRHDLAKAEGERSAG